MWLVQLPAMMSETELEHLNHLVQGTTQARMVRELCEAIEVLTATTPLIMVLEDLQWSDVSTLELLATLAQRPEFARVLILGTYRPAEAVLHAPVLRDVVQELRTRNQCDELAIELLTKAEVSSYVTGRLGSAGSESLVDYLFKRSGGNPLFLANLLAHLVQHDVVDHHHGQWVYAADKADVLEDVPEGLRSMILHRLEKQSEANRHMLDAASVAGATFSTASVAAGLAQSHNEVELACESLALQGDFLEGIGVETWSDGTLSGLYRFRHALYQQVLYEQIGEVRRVHLHRRIGERLEVGYGQRFHQIAAALAFHCEQGRNVPHAVCYRELAGEQALSRHAYREAEEHLRRALEGLERLPDTPQRRHQELDLLMALGPVLIATQGYAVPEVEQLYTRAQALCHQIGETASTFPVLWNLCSFYLVRAELQQARILAEQLFEMTQITPDVELHLMAHDAMAQVCFWQGELPAAHGHAEHVVTRYDHQQHQHFAPLYGQEDPGVACGSYDAWILWLRGYPDRALARMQETMALADALGNPHSLAFAMVFATFLYQSCRDVPATRKQAGALVTLATEQGFPHWIGLGALFQGWTLAMQGDAAGGLSQVEDGLNAWRATGSVLSVAYFLTLLAETHDALGQLDAARLCVSEAQTLVNHHGERFWEAELYRFDGALRLVSEDDWLQGAEAESCFRQALEVARAQQAKSLELRTAVSLSRLWQRQGKHDDARQLLGEVYGWFTEGFDTPDLQEANALLEALG
jgi:predicted ATPase